MKYVESSQIIPAKGMSYTMYEVTDDFAIQRMLTYIPDTDEIHIYPKPPVKNLYKPELCRNIEESLFSELWRRAEEAKK